MWRRRINEVSTTPLWQWGFRQCLSFSWITLRDKHCRHPIAVTGVLDTFGLCHIKPNISKSNVHHYLKLLLLQKGHVFNNVNIYVNFHFSFRKAG